VYKNDEKRKITGELDVYYIDYLCVDKLHRKKNIAPQLIQTHEYNQSYLNRKICVSLFKREEDLTGIIPLTIYKTYCFNMRNWIQPQDLSSNIKLLHGDKQNIYYLYNFINQLTKYQDKLDLTVCPEISNLIELVTSGNLFITMLVTNGEIAAVYIFKKTCTFIEKNKELISCIASFYDSKSLTKLEFIQGFNVSLWSVLNKQEGKTKIGYLAIEDISDNKHIIENICIKTHPYIISPTAYFFYNFAYSTFNSSRILIIN
jgi:hypothetical protein